MLLVSVNHAGFAIRAATIIVPILLMGIRFVPDLDQRRHRFRKRTNLDMVALIRLALQVERRQFLMHCLSCEIPFWFFAFLSFSNLQSVRYGHYR